MATSIEKQRNAKYSAIFQLGLARILSDSNFDEGKKAFNDTIMKQAFLFHAFKRLG